MMHERHSMKLTLDHNCIIALENNEPDAPYLRRLIAVHNLNKISLRVAAIGSSERLPSGGYPSHFSSFERRVAALGLQQIEFSLPVGKWGITFWGRSVWASTQSESLERAIHVILFPDIEFEYQDFCMKRGLDPVNSGELGETWRNAKCDVLALWSHINDGGNIFITSDRNYHKQSKKPQLIALGAGDILKPEEAVVAVP